MTGYTLTLHRDPTYACLESIDAMKSVVYMLVILVAVLHQDFWLWDNSTLVFDFMPIGLAYHTLYSLVCAGLWALAVNYAWPSHLEQFAGKEN